MAETGWMEVRLLRDTAGEDQGGPTNPDDAEVLIHTIIIYGTLFIVAWLLFCSLRQMSPRTYNVRGWVEAIRCKLASNQYGFVSWFWEVQTVSEKHFMDQCGFDALCTVRILQWASKCAGVGALGALWLIPVYGSSKPSEDTNYITDYVASITTAHVPPGSPRLIATAIGAYFFFPIVMYLLYTEFAWFRRFRHRFLQQPRPRNYTVYVHGIPEEYRADYDLAQFFQVCFGLSRVQEAHVRLDTPKLDGLAKKRDAIVQKLEHAINILNTNETRPTHKEDKTEVDSIHQYAYELREINFQINQRIEILEVGGGFDALLLNNKEVPMDINVQGEGEALGGAFVTFYNLSSKQAAIRMNHAREPFEMQVTEAPDPDDILWFNVGKSNAQIQAGSLKSLALTIAILLLWTIPIGFFSGLSNIAGMEDQFEFIRDALEKYPALGAILSQAAPLLVTMVNALLPAILRVISTMECHISHDMVQLSLFTKLAVFMIIQTFFVSAISGSIFAQLSAMIENPTNIISLLANELPTKSTFFIQLVFISTVLGLGIELLRIGPAILAWLRTCTGPNLTEEERNSPYLFLNPLAVPPKFNHASALSNVVLFCMILFVYAVIAPLTSIVLLAAFPILSSGYRNQFIYIYPPAQESGGRMWMCFVRIITNCLILAQFIISFMLGIKKSIVATTLMIPLILFTLLFRAFLEQRHFDVVECLPSHECHRKDAASDFYITESFEDMFVKPELLIKEAFPRNIDKKLLNQISLVPRQPPMRRKKRRKEDPSLATQGNRNTEGNYNTDHGDTGNNSGTQQPKIEQPYTQLPDAGLSDLEPVSFESQKEEAGTPPGSI